MSSSGVPSKHEMALSAKAENEQLVPLARRRPHARLLTTGQQLRETIHALQQIGIDELIFFAWSTELDQIDRVADVIG
jgi:hypothetical protein